MQKLKPRKYMYSKLLQCEVLGRLMRGIYFIAILDHFLTNEKYSTGESWEYTSFIVRISRNPRICISFDLHFSPYLRFEFTMVDSICLYGVPLNLISDRSSNHVDELYFYQMKSLTYLVGWPVAYVGPQSIPQIIPNPNGFIDEFLLSPSQSNTKNHSCISLRMSTKYKNICDKVFFSRDSLHI